MRPELVQDGLPYTVLREKNSCEALPLDPEISKPDSGVYAELSQAKPLPATRLEKPSQEAPSPPPVASGTWATLPDLPLDLYFLIVDFVMHIVPHADGHSRDQLSIFLSSCASVCRSWCLHFQPPLFERLKFTSESGLRDFIRLTAAPTSKITNYVRHLELEEQEEATPWVNVAMFLLYKRLPCLRSLRCSVRRRYQGAEGEFSLLPPQFRFTVATGVHTITLLVLSNYSYTSFAALARVFRALPHLLEVCLEQISWAGRVPSLQDERLLMRPKGASVLRRVTCIGVVASMPLLWLFCRGTAPTSEASLVASLCEDEAGTIVSLSKILLDPDDALFSVTLFRLEDCTCTSRTVLQCTLLTSCTIPLSGDHHRTTHGLSNIPADDKRTPATRPFRLCFLF
jgi:hypothetical protein